MIEIEALRNGKRKKFWVPVEKSDEDEDKIFNLDELDQNLIPELGVLVINVTEDLRRLLPGIRSEGGVLVAARALDAPYWDIGLLPDDIIFAINKQKFSDIAALQNYLKNYKSGDAVVLEIQRRKEMLYVAFEME